MQIETESVPVESAKQMWDGNWESAFQLRTDLTPLGYQDIANMKICQLETLLHLHGEISVEDNTVAEPALALVSQIRQAVDQLARLARSASSAEIGSAMQ